MESARFYMPTKKITIVDAINRRAAATGSVGYARASVSADYNGHALTLYFNDYRGYYVLEYHWGERVVLHRGEDFAAALVAAKREFARQGRGASLRISPLEKDVAIARADAELVEGDEDKWAWCDGDTWRFEEMSLACRLRAEHHLINAVSLEDFRKRVGLS